MGTRRRTSLSRAMKALPMRRKSLENSSPVSSRSVTHPDPPHFRQHQNGSAEGIGAAVPEFRDLLTNTNPGSLETSRATEESSRTHMVTRLKRNGCCRSGEEPSARDPAIRSRNCPVTVSAKVRRSALTEPPAPPVPGSPEFRLQRIRETNSGLSRIPEQRSPNETEPAEARPKIIRKSGFPLRHFPRKTALLTISPERFSEDSEQSGESGTFNAVKGSGNSFS